MKQVISLLRAERSDALLCVAIDAADNAQAAAEEIGERRSFARDLLREQMPEGVRLVILCRTHRQGLLDPPHTLRLELLPFSRAETAAFLRQAFPDATEHDVDEFNRLSSHNPRVQATALSRKAPLPEILRALGPNPRTVDDTVEGLLNSAVAELRDKVGQVEKSQIDLICAGLAALRPLVPIATLAAIAGVETAAIKSFAIDLGRPLIVLGDTIQFFDEPAETWFREERFRPTRIQLVAFIETLKPLATTDAYVSSALPQLMLEASQFAELVELALSSAGLPEGNPIEKRDVGLQRLQFALKASLRTKRYTDAAKLALKAGGETAGDERQQKLIRANTDLASVFMEADRIQEIVSRRTFGGGWIGSHHVYEAGFMSGRSELRGDARSRLRMAHEWLRNWSRLPDEQQKHEPINDDDIAEMAMAHFNIHGADGCARSFRGWTPREVSFRAGRILARRFVDHGRYEDLDQLAVAAENDLCLVLAITLELREVHRSPPKEVVGRALRLVLNTRVKLKEATGWDGKETVLRAVTALVEAGCKLSVHSTNELGLILARYLPDSPPRELSSRFGAARFPLLRAYTLQAALSGRSLELIDLAHPELRKELESNNSHHDLRNAQEFKEDVGALLPWHQLWARALLGLTPSDKLAAAIADVRSASSKAAKIGYRDEPHTFDEIARLWLEILIQVDGTSTEHINDLNRWIDSMKRPLNAAALTRLARLAARTSSMGPRSLEYASSAFALTRDERADAETKASAYVDLARALLTISKSEAAVYFDQAVEVASKVGDENVDRWAAILDLADRAANSDRPTAEIAYKIARCAELTYDYVFRDKHFDWEATVRAIAALSPSSSLAILSRWRDRNFGSEERLLPAAVHFLLERRLVDPKAALAFVGFRARWDCSLLLSSALDACVSKADKETALAYLYGYMRLDGQSALVWRNVKQVSASHGLTIPHIDELIAFSERKELPNQSRDGIYNESASIASDRKDELDWDDIFFGINLSAANDIYRAYGRFKESGPPFYHDRFFKEACKRASIGKEAEFVRALSHTAEFDLYHFRNFLEQIPEAWKTRLAITSALADTLRTFCRRYCMAITKSRYYEVLPFKTACELSGVAEGGVIDVVLSAIGEATEVVGAGRLFTLVGLLASKLSDKEALEALSFGLGLFESILNDGDGDGPWAAALIPPTETDEAIAGYIWAGMAVPEARLRWEAAHVVRGLCTLGREVVVGNLISLAQRGTAGPFADARLHFYRLHARQWLLVALARVANENPAALLPYADILAHYALRDEPHVLTRRFAAKAVLALADSGNIQIEPSVSAQLQAVNTSQLPIAHSKRHKRHWNHVHSKHRESGSKRFSFGYDMGRYWFESLGDCFAKTSSEIEEAAEGVICDDWGLSENGHWDRDERARRGFFRDSESHHSHGFYPRLDDLNFYLSYHAMMTVAGKLLATVPLHEDPDDLDDEFGDWLSRHSLSRNDGRWLADRRDPVPLDWPSWKDEKQEDDWRWSVRRDDFERLLGLSDGRLNLWGSWISTSGSREEFVHIRSALVSSDRSEALLRALQTATNADDYRIPAANDELQIDRGQFLLQGWVLDRDCDSGLDEFDPWAGHIRYPPIKPAEFVLKLLYLGSDTENRTWHMQADNQKKILLWSQIWGCYREKGDEPEGEWGKRLQASFTFVVEFLRKIKMDLIVEVQIERRMRRFRYESRKDDDPEYIPPSARLFTIKSDGIVRAL